MNDPVPERIGTAQESPPTSEATAADAMSQPTTARRLTPIPGVPMVTSTIAPLDVPVRASPDEIVPPYVRRAMTGDAAAFRDVYAHHRRDVARLANRLLGPRGDLDDVIQEVFIQVFRSLPAFRGDSRFTTWLHRVTVNVVLMHLRAQRSRPQYAPEAPAETTPANDTASPLDNVARNERMKALYRILDSVSDKKRTVFILHDLEGVAAADISKMVGAPVLTVRTRLFYARKEVYAAMASEPALDAIARELSMGSINTECP